MIGAVNHRPRRRTTGNLPVGRRLERQAERQDRQHKADGTELSDHAHTPFFVFLSGSCVFRFLLVEESLEAGEPATITQSVAVGTTTHAPHQARGIGKMDYP
jgi:hypothetical protein